MEAKHIIAFILGGIVFLALQPILAGIAIIGILGLILLFIIALLIPGGWMMFFFFRNMMWFFGRVFLPITILLATSLIILFISTVLGPTAGIFLSFLLGGLAGLMVVSRIFPRGSVRQVQRPVFSGGGRKSVLEAGREVGVKYLTPKGCDVAVVTVKKVLFSKRGGLFIQAFRNGVIVFGEASTLVVRTLVEGALEKGERVVIIGSPYLAAYCEGTRLVTLGKTSFNAIKPLKGDRFTVRRWAENIAIPLVLSAGLDTAEAGMVIRFIEKFGGARITPNDVDKLVSEYGPTSSARLKDALGMLTTFFGEGYPEPEKLFGGEWRQLILDTRGLSQEAQLFVGMYLLYESPRLFPGCILVFDSAELGIPEQQILPYDARHVWLRTLKTVERLKESGFIMSSSTGLLALELLDLADTYIITRGPANIRRSLSERIGVDVNIAAIPIGRAVVFTRATPDGNTYLFEGEIIESPICDIEGLKAEEDGRNTLLMEQLLSHFRDTLLFAELADLAEYAYKVLRIVKKSQAPTPERISTELGIEGEKALKQLLEKQYVLTDPAGVLGLTSLGEHALKDWEQKVAEKKALQPSLSSPWSQQSHLKSPANLSK